MRKLCPAGMVLFFLLLSFASCRHKREEQKVAQKHPVKRSSPAAAEKKTGSVKHEAQSTLLFVLCGQSCCVSLFLAEHASLSN